VSAGVGNPLFEELLHIHGLIRADLAKVELLAEDCAGGAAPAELRARIGKLKSSSLLWQLKLGCLRHCRFVHGHHGLEDRAVFPSVRRVAPELGPAVDRLERDHREVADLLVTVERAALEIEVPGGRERLVAGLTELSAVLLDHLAREERDLEPALARMHSWLG
jgi:hypothetical protein